MVPGPRAPSLAPELPNSLAPELPIPEITCAFPNPDPPNLRLFPQSQSPNSPALPPISLTSPSLPPAKRNPSKAGRGGGDCAGWRGAEEPRANHPARRRRGKRGQEPSRVPRRRSGADARRRHHRSAQRRASRPVKHPPSTSHADPLPRLPENKNAHPESLGARVLATYNPRMRQCLTAVACFTRARRILA